MLIYGETEMKKLLSHTLFEYLPSYQLFPYSQHPISAMFGPTFKWQSSGHKMN